MSKRHDDEQVEGHASHQVDVALGEAEPSEPVAHVAHDGGHDHGADVRRENEAEALHGEAEQIAEAHSDADEHDDAGQV